MKWLIGLLGSLSIAAAAYRKTFLSFSGAWAAVVLGTLMFALGSLPWYGTLLAFFISSSLLTQWKRRQKQKLENVYEKGGTRDAMQVWANGGLGLALCAADAVWSEPVLWIAFVGVMSAVTADTWATEIGSLSSRHPVSILNGRTVEPGVSGGVTGLGLSAALFGGLFIGCMAWLFMGLGPLTGFGHGLAFESHVLNLLPVIGGVSGFAGAVVDSYLGAAVQLMHRCRICGKETEKNRHCSTDAERIRGLKHFNNDAVNALSSAAGGLLAVMLYRVIMSL
jgi:uncharacterized protein (TIGR00297 family)